MHGASKAEAEQSVSVMAGTSVLTAMMICLPGILPEYHDVLNLFRELLENVMAARIHRRLKLGLPEHATICAACDMNLTMIHSRLTTAATQELGAEQPDEV